MVSMAQVRRRLDTGFAWASMAFAVVGGALAAGTGIADFVSTIIHSLPWVWLPGVLLFLAFAGIVMDLIRDGEPNQIAVAGAILLPSLAVACHGSLAHWVVTKSHAFARPIASHLEAVMGTSSQTGLAVASIAIALFAASRVVPKKSRGGGRARASVSIGG